MPMITKEQLKDEIFAAFGSVPFPLHRGLHAAMAVDDWIEDENILKQITAEQDYIGEWWNVPIDHLRSCMKALCYLDDHDMEFYLPAYMLAIISEPTCFDSKVRSSSWQVLYVFLPNDDPELADYFYYQLSQILGNKKKAVHDFLTYIESREEYNEHARSIATEALKHKYWNSLDQK